MAKFRNVEDLISWIVDFFSERFGNSAILKGGLSLRLLHSPRYTNDADYVFVPFRSKNAVKTLVESALDSVKDLSYESSMNSKALRILISFGGQSAQVEIAAEESCKSIPISSSLLSVPYGRPARIVRIMEPGISFAHKIAAWNERELSRDLYDIYQYESLFKTRPDLETLNLRLQKARSYAGIVAAKNIGNLIGKLRNAAENLSDERIADLRPLLNEEELAGLAFRLRPSLLALIETLTRG